MKPIQTPPLDSKKLEEMFNISDFLEIKDVTAGTDYPVTLRLSPENVNDILTEFNRE